ncbi:hypothetical protein JZ751_010389, partial [Albula glossodonta]
AWVNRAACVCQGVGARQRHHNLAPPLLIIGHLQVTRTTYTPTFPCPPALFLCIVRMQTAMGTSPAMKIPHADFGHPYDSRCKETFSVDCILENPCHGPADSQLKLKASRGGPGKAPWVCSGIGRVWDGRKQPSERRCITVLFIELP